MGANFLYFLIWIVIMTILLWLMPNKKIDVIGNFFKKVLPNIPFTSILRIWKQKKEE